MNGAYNGVGELRNILKDVTFRGNFLAGSKHGFGVEYWPNGGMKFAGDYRKNERSGYGTEFDMHGFKLREGVWKEGSFIG